KSLGMQVEGNLGAYFTTNLTTRFTEMQRTLGSRLLALQSAGAVAVDRGDLEEFSLTTQFLGDRVSLNSSRRASSHIAASPGLDGGGAYQQDKFNAWVWRSARSSLSIEGTSSKIGSGFQAFGQAPQARNEESQQLKSKLSYGRTGVFVTQRDARALAPDR